MRKITEQAAYALRTNQRYSNNNTQVIDGNVMALHGNTIAIFDSLEGKLTIRDSGWQTNTTKERLNGILSEFNSEWRIYQQKGIWYITDGAGKKEEWKGFLTLDV